MSRKKPDPWSLASCVAWQLRESRLTRGVSQVDAARAAGIKPQSLSKIERGIRKDLGVNMLARLCGAIGVAPSLVIECAASALCKHGRTT